MKTYQLLKWLFYFVVVTIFISFTYFVYNKSDLNTVPRKLQIKEEIVYKEKDVELLFEKLKQEIHYVNKNKMAKLEITEQPKKSHIDYLAKYPNFMDCTIPKYKKWDSKTAIKNQVPDYSLPAPEKMFKTKINLRKHY